MTIPTYPLGVKPLLPEEARRRRELEQMLLDPLEAEGFEEIILPIIDFSEPYSGILDPEVVRQSYRFTDREGDLVMVRSDFTPMIARAIAPELPRYPQPLKLFYRGDVIRCEPSRLGSRREIFQIGAEIVGGDTAEADVNVLTTAARMLAATGRKPTIVFNDFSLLETLLSGLDRASASTLRRAIVSKNRGEVRRLSASLDRISAVVIGKLVDGSARLTDFLQLEATAERAARLQQIENTLDRSLARFVLVLDDFDDENLYYTGLRFRLYSAGGNRIGGGGRYDGLYKTFGADAAAVGFTLTLDQLEAVESVETPQLRVAGGTR